MNTRNVLLIGRTGNGKSTLANLLVNQVDESGKFIEEFKEIFKEGEGATSQTYKIQEKDVEIDGIKYNLIDTVGLGDTELSEKQVLKELKDKINSLENGLNQILFVFAANKKFTKEEEKTFEILYKDIFAEDEKVVDYITIVCTNFKNFNKSEKCEEDKEKLLAGVGKVASIVKSCGKRVIYVDNPSSDDEELKSIYLKKRENSRKVLVSHLKTCQEVYKPVSKKSEEQESQKVSHYSGTFHEVVYGGDIKAGDYANFGKIGVQNREKVQTQHNYLGEEQKKTSSSTEKAEVQKQQSLKLEQLEHSWKKLTITSSEEDQQSLLIIQLKDKTLTSEEISKVRDYLVTKKIFLNARQETIKELQECYDKWDKLSRKSNMVGEVGSTISSVVGSITNVITFGIPKAVGEAIKSSSNFTKIAFSEKGNQEFQLSLVNENELSQFNDSCNSLVNTLNLEDSLENTKYKIYDIIIKDGIWEGKFLSLEEIRKIIVSLNENLKDELEKEWNQEIKDLKDKFGAGSINRNSVLQEVLQKQIEFKKTELKQLVKSAKENKLLKSDSSNSSLKKERNETREKLLDKLEKGVIDGEEFKKEFLKTKKDWDENEKVVNLIDNLCEVRRELTQLQRELESLKNQQTTEAKIIVI